MSIQAFIQEHVFAPRLKTHQVLVVYDPDQRYRNACLDMTLDDMKVVDASDSSIESRTQAITAMVQLGQHEIEKLLIYVPKQKPLEEEDRQRDPFALYMACGSTFPDGDGDSYLSLCLKAKPDYSSQVRAVFDQDPSPDFAVIDAIGNIQNWPNLRALLKQESARDILFALLFPSPTQKSALKDSASWVTETKELLQVSLGLSPKTKGKTWSPIADEMWRYLLFSEFAYDLPESLPESLKNIPRAESNSRPLVEDICDRLRNDKRTQTTYIERAEALEQELNLVDTCSHIQDLGSLDTFPFEERTFLHHAIEALQNNALDKVRTILSDHAESIWTGIGESQVQWDLLKSALALLEACENNDTALSDHSKTLSELTDFYITQLREVDTYHREFEQAVSDYIMNDTAGIMLPIQEQLRYKYGSLMGKVQFLFTKHFQESGWPIDGRLSNADVFDKLVGPALEQSGHKIAFIMVDALRYELGLALEKQLADDSQVDIQPALAQLPSITAVGMASLLPNASANLNLTKKDSGFHPHHGELPVGNVSQRMDIFKKRYGNRFQEGRLEKFVQNGFSVAPDTDLLVLRSVEIDSQFENNPEAAPGEILNALKRIRVVVHKLKDAKFQEVVIATDHGFFMNTHAGAGDTCKKPIGNWVNVHERSMLGAGNIDDPHHFSIDAEKAGIRGDFKKFIGPLSLASYKSGMLYYHGGVSLQECILPVIHVRFGTTTEPESNEITAVLSYKDGAKRITTRLPVISLGVDTVSLFPNDAEIEILLEAQDAEGNVIGEAKRGGIVNSASGTITLTPGQHVQVTMKMDMEYEGKFVIKALNPTTMLTYDQINLKTDYAV